MTQRMIVFGKRAPEKSIAVSETTNEVLSSANNPYQPEIQKIMTTIFRTIKVFLMKRAIFPYAFPSKRSMSMGVTKVNKGKKVKSSSFDMRKPIPIIRYATCQ